MKLPTNGTRRKIVGSAAVIALGAISNVAVGWVNRVNADSDRLDRIEQEQAARTDAVKLVPDIDTQTKVLAHGQSILFKQIDKVDEKLDKIADKINGLVYYQDRETRGAR